MLPYESYNIVKLKKLIEQEEWFQLADGKIEGATKENYDDGFPPERISITIVYKEHDMLVQVCDYVSNKHPYCTISSSHTKRRRFKYLNIPKTLKIVKQVMLEETNHVEKEIVTEKEREHIVAENRDTRDALAEAIGIQGLEIDNETSDTYVTFGLKLSTNHHIWFKKLKNEESFVVNMSGKFQIESIKNIIKVVTDCPEPMADRLTNGK